MRTSLAFALVLALLVPAASAARQAEGVALPVRTEPREPPPRTAASPKVQLCPIDELGRERTCYYSTPDKKVRGDLASLKGATDLATTWNVFRHFRNNLRSFRDEYSHQDNLARRSGLTIYRTGWWSGCIEAATVAATMLRAVGIPVRFIHAIRATWAREFLERGRSKTYQGHTFLELMLEGKWYLVDVVRGEIYDRYDPANPYLPEGYIRQYRGGDMYDFGITDSQSLHESMRSWVRDHPDIVHGFSAPRYVQVGLELEPGPFTEFLTGRAPAEAAPDAAAAREVPKGPPASLAASHLPGAGTGHWELWTRRAGKWTRQAAFDVVDRRLVDVRFGLALEIPTGAFEKADGVGVAWAQGKEVDEKATGTPVFLLAGSLAKGRATLSPGDFDAVGIMPRPVDLGFLIGAQTVPGGLPPQGLWWCTGVVAGSQPRPSFNLPALPQGWTYAHWLTMPGKPSVLLGRFRSGFQADSDGAGPGAGPGTPRCPGPGQDFVKRGLDKGAAPPADLAALDLTLTVTLEPDGWKEATPFPLVLIETRVAGDTEQSVRFDPSILPSLEVNVR